MIYNEQEEREAVVLDVAKKMMVAARTAPKTRGVDQLTVKVITREDVLHLADKMEELAPVLEKQFFVRDADNLRKTQAVLLLGAKKAKMGLDCAYCGFATCGEKPIEVPCVFPMHDLGIAVGSAVSVAANHRVDNRVMFSAGVAAMKLGLMDDCHMVIAVPLSVSAKSPYFDRG